IGFDTEESGDAPKHDRAKRDQGKAAPAEGAARQHRPQLVLAAPQQILQVGRSWPRRLRSRAPRPAAAARSPGPAALIAPWHERLSSAAGDAPAGRFAGEGIWEPFAAYNAPVRRATSCCRVKPFPLL